MTRAPDLRCAPFVARVLLVLLALSVGSFAPAQEEASGTTIDSIRQDLVELRFEKALAAIEALIDEPGMSASTRAELLVLRSQTHVAFGDLDAAERDFGEILTARPGFVPDPSLMPRKAMDRFTRVQQAMVGWLELALDPPGAALSVDGRQVVLEGGALALLAGSHELRVEQAGHDPLVQSIEVEAGAKVPVTVQLVPNARTVVLRTEPADVEVLLDGDPIGRTARPEGGIGDSGELVVENVPLGEHVFELRRACYRTQRVRETLTVDLLDRSPRRMRAVALVPARATLTLGGGPAGAEVSVDGSQVGQLPVEPLQLCPGERTIGVSYGGRLIWATSRKFEEGAAAEVAVLPRPNAVLVGADRWPDGLRSLAERFNLAGDLALPAGSDLSTPSGWKDVALPPGTDLAIAVLPAAREGMQDDWLLYSPILRVVREIERAPDERPRPLWRHRVWGLGLVDSRFAGAALVVVVAASSPAASAGLAVGDRLVTVDGKPVASATEVRAAFSAAATGRPVPLTWTTRSGEQRDGALVESWSPVIIPPPDEPEWAMQLAGWAVVDSIVDRENGPAALSSLALLFSAFGHHDLAAETWRRVGWGGRRGIGEGTTQYYLARELERLGREDDATAAYRRAAESAATVFDDEGPPVAPAARDRLADLGVTSIEN